MPGKAYNPKGFEPEVHERFDAPPPEAMEAYRKAWMEHRARRPSFTYEESQEYRRRGESHILGHYVYEQMFNIYYGIEDELIEGAWDTHLHIYPDYVPRCIDMIELAIDASKAKMAGLVCKDHFFSNVGAAWAAQWVAEDMVRRGELDYACQVLGTHILAWSHHPDQVNLGRKYPNLGAIFFSTMTAPGMKGVGPPIIDDKGKLMPDVKQCIQACAKYKVPIMTGHRTWDERFALAREAQEAGASMLMTHAGSIHGVTVADAVKNGKELRKCGVYIEVNGNSMLPNMMWPQVNPNDVLDYLTEMGPDHIIFNTDFGQAMCHHPVEEFKLLVRMMIYFGIPNQDIKTMIQTNPAKYLYLED